MPRLLLIHCFVLLSCAVGAAGASAATDDSGPRDASPGALSQPELHGRDLVAALIEQLGSEQFAVRRRAEQQLIDLGAAAYDQLKQAENDADLEIVDRARYILYQIEIAWARPDDPHPVKRVLERYPDLGQEQRYLMIQRLGQWTGQISFGPLCRIARYESSPRLARHAALAAMAVTFDDKDFALRVAELSEQELGGGERAPIEWIRIYADQAERPAEAVERWSHAVDAELDVLLGDGDQSHETDVVVLLKLMEHRLRLCQELNLVDETLATLDSLTRLSESEPEHRVLLNLYLESASSTGQLHPSVEAAILFLERGLATNRVDATAAATKTALTGHALRWIIDNQAWQVHGQFLRPRDDLIQQDRLLSYLTATAYTRQGKDQLGDATADRAFNMPDDASASNDAGRLNAQGDAAQQRLDCADAIAELGQVEWAKREYRYVLERDVAPDWLTINAASDLAMWLHDRQEHRAASDAIGQLCDRLDADAAAKRRLIGELNQRYANGMGAGLLKQMYVRRAYYLACHYEASGQYDQQREQLLAAMNYFAGDANAIDPDVLIAMYRSPEADQRFRQRTLAQLRIAKRHFQQRVDSQPEAPWVYNQWAWLVANTEGDFQRAIRYSKNSLKLKPGEPSYLDTLGRCYYAAGDLENAVKHQRQAVELQPHVHVIRRQLEQFESELASRTVN